MWSLKPITYIVVLLFVVVLAYLFSGPYEDRFYDYDWSSSWSELDRKARADAVCTPITTIYRKMGPISAYIWIVPDSCEQGLPHTRSIDVIAIPKSYPQDRLATTLEHEKIHLFQRMHPGAWRLFYRKGWNYELYTEPPAGMPSSLVKMRRANPDTADAPWICWRGDYWAVPIYQSATDLSLRKAPVKWWRASDLSVSNKPPDDWLAFFGDDVHQHEHPHEISAEYLCAEEEPQTEAFRVLKNAWLEMYPQI